MTQYGRPNLALAGLLVQGGGLHLLNAFKLLFVNSVVNRISNLSYLR